MFVWLWPELERFHNPESSDNELMISVLSRIVHDNCQMSQSKSYQQITDLYIQVYCLQLLKLIWLTRWQPIYTTTPECSQKVHYGTCQVNLDLSQTSTRKQLSYLNYTSLRIIRSRQATFNLADTQPIKIMYTYIPQMIVFCQPALIHFISTDCLVTEAQSTA